MFTNFIDDGNKKVSSALVSSLMAIKTEAQLINDFTLCRLVNNYEAALMKEIAKYSSILKRLTIIEHNLQLELLLMKQDNPTMSIHRSVNIKSNLSTINEQSNAGSTERGRSKSGQRQTHKIRNQDTPRNLRSESALTSKSKVNDWIKNNCNTNRKVEPSKKSQARGIPTQPHAGGSTAYSKNNYK